MEYGTRRPELRAAIWVLVLSSLGTLSGTRGLAAARYASAAGDWVSADRGDTSGFGARASETSRHPADAADPSIEWSRPRALPAIYEGSEALRHELELAVARPTALASGDFDGDGVEDLVCGYAGSKNGIVTLHRGNVDAIFPYAPAARRRKALGRFTEAPFLSPAGVHPAPVGAEFLGAGDFDNDGNLDVVVAARGDASLHLLAGDGTGHLEAKESVKLPGLVLAMVTGEIGPADGLADIAVSVRGPEGLAMVVLRGPEGAVRSGPEVTAMPAHAHAHATTDPDRLAVLGLSAAAGIDSPDWIAFAEERTGVSPLAARPMRLGPDAITDLVLLQEGGGSASLSSNTAATVITVDTTLDNAVGGDGDCTLREALNNSNSDGIDTTGGDCAVGSGADEIHFNIGGGGATATIALTSELPAATDPVTINGNTQGCAGPPCIELDGTSAGTSASGLLINGGNSTIRGLVINRFDSVGIELLSDNNLVEGNFLGTDITGTVALANGLRGLLIGDGMNNTVGGTVAEARNVISGNDENGVWIVGPLSDGNQVLGNYIGVDVSGTVDLGNGLYGVEVESGSDNTIGGTVAGAHNVISGNAQSGVLLDNADGNRVQGNYLGTDVTGTVDLGNTRRGLLVGDSANNTIGGTAVGARNVISGNDENGIWIAGFLSDGNQVLGNYIGVDVTGSTAVGNGLYGVEVESGSGNTIGGTNPGARNVISGNADSGVLFDNTNGNLVQGNYIGTDASGTLDLGNTSQGVLIGNSVTNTIGGTEAGARNIISGNGENGIWIAGNGGSNQVSGNYIGVDVSGSVGVGNGLHGVEVETSGNTIGGTSVGARNVISGNGQSGILFDSAGASRVLGNYIGVDVSGAIDLGNGWIGVEIQAGGNNEVGGTLVGSGNVISGNGEAGILITNSPDNTVQGNYIGTDAAGTTDLGNALQGVRIQTGSSGNTIGGTAAEARNVISGNDDAGVLIDGSSNNVVLGNYVGTDLTGTVDLGNALQGVRVQAGSTGNTLGGTAAGAGNVISGNDDAGVLIDNASSNEVLGNYLGTDLTGTADLGNVLEGVRIQAGSTSNTVGGNATAARNLISGNDGNGVMITGTTTSSNLVQGNYIGTDVTRWAPLGNAFRGVHLADGAHDNTIGGTGGGEGNVIAHHAQDGVGIIGSGIGNRILGNSIASNGLLGIDLVEDGVTLNDNRDPDTGPNDLQNYPTLTQADATPTPDITLAGDFNSVPREAYRIEFFASSACNGSGFGDAGRFLGFTTETTGGNGDVSFSLTLVAPVSDGEVITATATNPANSTSELAECFVASCSGFVVFPHSINAPDKNTLEWPAPEDVKFAKGDLAAVDTYATTGDGFLIAATTLDISTDDPTPGNGLYYLVKPLGCGGWETTSGAEPGRDGALP